MEKPIGLYIHVPFCLSKCPYCDFYSVTSPDGEALDGYADAVIRSLARWHEEMPGVAADTLYFGGGTPSALGGERIARIIDAAAGYFGLKNAEITMETNPGDNLRQVFTSFAAAGGNRVSIGVQSINQEQLKILGRRHTPEDATAAVSAAKAAGIENVSIDFILGIPCLNPEEMEGQAKGIVESASYALRLGVKHISAYILKIEENTPFYSRRDSLLLPDEDMTATIYLTACETFDLLGFKQYEISNFAIPGYESRHNLKYWNCDPYLGIGPSAYSYIDGRRFYYPSDIKAFMEGCSPVSEGGEEIIQNSSGQEYIMLRLRLSEGVTNEGYMERFGTPLPRELYERAAKLPSGLLVADSKGIRLTKYGFLLSNAIISHLLFD
ncbi:MAG TPA: radical SAM family heme chaperone HemW [Clostridiales bacterium]|nr:radical SAM family heme chaperone HemW [Clostridiales bacterium]